MTLRATHDEWTIQQIVDAYAKKQLNLSPAFQRQSVWSDRDRQKLVLSLLGGIPIPTMFLARRSGRGGRPIYDVIDGKQRIETVLLFLGRGPLAARADVLWVKTSFSDDEPLDWWSWRDLGNDIRHSFLATKLPAVEVEGGIDELTTLFVAINSTGRRLTGAERRNAQYLDNPILKKAKAFADGQRSYFLKHRVFSQSQIARMKHVELVTELLLSVHAERPSTRRRVSIECLMDRRWMRVTWHGHRAISVVH